MDGTKSKSTVSYHPITIFNLMSANKLQASLPSEYSCPQQLSLLMAMPSDGKHHMASK
jgi:hypothetical protein